MTDPRLSRRDALYLLSVTGVAIGVEPIWA